MTPFLILLIQIFIVKHIIEIWLMFTYKNLIKGGIILGATEAVEIPFIIYLIIKGGIAGFLVVILVEIAEWLTIGFLTLKGK